MSAGTPRPAPRIAWMCAAVAVAALMIGLRVAWPESDPYARLSWSSGLLTDEGFYIHNARNLVLFGAERTDGFNNMLLMPTLHIVQLAVFRAWGVGAVQARTISVVCSLLGLMVLFAAARRAFGLRTAVYTVLIAGLDHTNLLYNRLALMDTPGEMLLIFALYAWVRATAPPRSRQTESGWLAVCGAILALAFITRGLAAIVIPAVFLAVALGARARPESPAVSDASKRSANGTARRAAAGLRQALPIAVGLAVVVTVYAACWYWPNRAEMASASRYYLWGQLLPRDGQRLVLNAANAWFGDERGAAPFLMRHAPIQVVLVFGWVCLLWRRRKRSDAVPAVAPRFTGPTAVFALCWLACSALLLTAAS
jgi:hypothetical protein